MTRRFPRLAAAVALVLLAWRNRGVLARAARIVARAPSRVRRGDAWDDLVDEVRLELLLAGDPAVRRDPSISVELVDGVAVLRGPAGSPTLRAAEERARTAPMVQEVRIDDPAARLAPTGPPAAEGG